MNNTDSGPSARPPYKRKVRNYLLDVGLQLRYTATIVIVAIFLTAGLGFKMYQATRDVSKVILWTSLVDPSSAEELQAQFANSDRVVLWGIVGFGVVLVFSIGAVGILITHKVAGPLHKIAALFGARARQPHGPGAGEPAQGRRAAGVLRRVPRHAPGACARASRKTCACSPTRSRCWRRRPTPRATALADAARARGAAPAAQAQGRSRWRSAVPGEAHRHDSAGH